MTPRENCYISGYEGPNEIYQDVLDMEVWLSADGIFLGQGKYAMKILKRFGMMDYKAMDTPMESNLELLSDASSESVDATMYRQMIGSLMYLMNTRPDICFAMNTLRQFLTRSETCSLDCCKAYFEVPKGYSLLWAQE